jgi:hypothetical protein
MTDKAYDTADHVANLRAINVTPHMTQNNGIIETGKYRRSAIEQTDHAPPGLWHVATAPGDDRMHLRLGQAARYATQNIAASVALPISYLI